MLSPKSGTGNCLQQLNALTPIKVISGHPSGIMDGFGKIAKEAFTPENKAKAAVLESYFEMTLGEIFLFDFGLAYEDSSPGPEKETLLLNYPKTRLNGNPFILIHENGTGVVYWNPKSGLVFDVPHDEEIVKIISLKPFKEPLTVISRNV